MGRGPLLPSLSGGGDSVLVDLLAQHLAVGRVDVVDKSNWNKTTVTVDAADGKVLGQKVDKD
ncbi:hypothetical protein [Streptomyces sp. E5N91]|uniref:hypothetical protein n=1 Tax=Streptomyces sp. E5N91 TaxID=1851996 RepID=UPI000EF5CC86|nr:hypothetical protein [Streptomyces sp. E5N91]